MRSVPTDLQKALAANPAANAAWKTLTPIARRDFVSWVTSAKQAETRKRRIERTPDMLLSGKRRPCCYAVVPMNLYSALTASPKSKKQWQTLTPDERRDFTDWIEAAKDTEMRERRIEKARALLAAGKRPPAI